MPDLVARQHNRINYVNDAIVSCDISLNDLRAIYGDAIAALCDSQNAIGFGLERADMEGAGEHLVGGELAGQNVVREDGCELILVFGLEKVFNRARWQLGEGFVRWGKNRDVLRG